MGAPNYRPKRRTEGTVLYAAEKQCSEMRKKNDVEKRAAVGRLVRAGLTDFQVGKRLHLTAEKVAEHRAALSLKANPKGGAFD